MPLEWLMLLLCTAAIRAPLRLVGEVMNDQSLIDAVARGEASSALALYDRLRPLISKTIRRLTARGADHEDLVQQTFVELLVSLKARPAIRSLDAWAATIAARTAYQRMRRDKLERRFAASPFEQTAPDPATPAAGPLTTTVHREAVERVLAHLEHVNGKHAEVYLLHDVHGFELKEIAEILGITVANAQTRLVRGRGDVRARIEKDVELTALLSERLQ